MKKVYLYILPVLLLLSVEAKSQAYTYHPFPDSNAVWKGYNFCGAMGNASYSYWTLQVTQDTIINGFNYHRVSPNGCMREDSAKRVYALYLLNPFQEHLLYNFSFNVGDTMTSWYYSNKLIVLSVDTPTYWGVQRRTLHITDSIHFGVEIDKWIEGIGSSSGPMGYEIGGFCHWSHLCAAWADTTMVYGDGSFPDQCSYLTSVGEIPFERLIVLPNPCTTSFTIQLSSPPTTQTYFNLYDALGRAVKRDEIISETTTMSRNNLPSGIYFWQLQQGNKILDRGKVVME